MANNATTLLAGAYAEIYPALSNRDTLLCLVGYFAGVTGLTAAQAIAGAKAQQYAALSDRDLTMCILEVLS